MGGFLIMIREKTTKPYSSKKGPIVGTPSALTLGQTSSSGMMQVSSLDDCYVATWVRLPPARQQGCGWGMS